MVHSDKRFQRQQPTDGPGGAASFYPDEYVADKGLGTGTDGFVGGGNKGKVEPIPDNQMDYRATFRGGGGGGGDIGQTQAGPSALSYPAATTQPNIGVIEHDAALVRDGMAPYPNLNPPQFQQQGQQLYNPSPNTSNAFLPPDYHRTDEYNHQYHQQQQQQQLQPQHQYPPQSINNHYGFSQSSFDLRTPLASAPFNDRPDTPGIYRDRAPRMEKLTSEQREIAESFPKDLDEEGGSLLRNVQNMLKNWRSFIRWKFVPYYILIIVLAVLVALMTIYHKQIVDWLTPISKKVRELKWGWVIPVAILFVISFPPLFGHEIVGVLCGVVYGLWIGFGILSLGTLLGELGNFYAFKFLLKKHGEKFERKSIDYACMAHIVREGGFLVVLMARLSAIPGHFTTAVFATVGMNVFIFTLAAILSLPKQLVVVYLGVAIEQSGNGQESTKDKVIKWVVIIISFAVTIGVAIFLYGKMSKARPLVQERLRERRYQMLTEAGSEQVNIEMLNNNDDFSSMNGHTKQYSGYADETLSVSAGQNVSNKKKGGIWSRLGGKSKGKEAALSPHYGNGRIVDGQHEMAMQQQYNTKVSFETDSSQQHHHNGAFYNPYQDQTLRPGMGMSFGDQYMSRAPPYSADARLSNVSQKGEIAATSSSSPDRDVYRQSLLPNSAPLPYQQSSNGRIEEQRQGGQQPNNQYQHHANVGSIYHLPKPSQDSTSEGNYAMAM